MINYTPTPDFYNDYICHYNHNHDPKNGQFASSRQGVKVVKARRVADSNQDMFNDTLYRAKTASTKKEKKEALKDFNNQVKEVSKDEKASKRLVKKQAKKSFKEREREIEVEDQKRRFEQERKAASDRARKNGYTDGYIKFVEKEAGGFNMVDDPDLFDILEKEYSKSGKKVRK